MNKFELVTDSKKAKEVSENTYVALHKLVSRTVSTASILIRVIAIAAVYYASKMYLKDIRVVGFLTLLAVLLILIDEWKE